MNATDRTEAEMEAVLRRLTALARTMPPGRFRRSIEHDVAGQQRKLNRLRARRAAALKSGLNSGLNSQERAA